MPDVDTSPLGNQFHRYYQRLQPVMKKQRNRATTTAVFSFLAVSLFVFYAIRPTAQTIILLRREIADKTELNKRMEDKITTLIQAQTNYETASETIPVINEALPVNPDAVVLARKLQHLASISGATISALQMPSLPILANEATPGAKTAPKPDVTEFPVNIVLTGTYTSLKAFLDGLLNMRRIVTIDTINFKRATGITGNDPNALQLSTRLKSFYTSQ